MKIVDEELLFSLNIPKLLGEIGFNICEAHLCLQLSQVSYLSVDKQRKIMKKYKFKRFKSFSKLNTHAYMCSKNDTLFIIFRGSDLSNKNDIIDNRQSKNRKS